MTVGRSGGAAAHEGGDDEHCDGLDLHHPLFSLDSLFRLRLGDGLTRTRISLKIRTVKAIVTGATGFIGRHLIDRLRVQGCEVWALVRDPARAAELEKKNVRPLRGDLFSIPPLPDGFDLVFHLAGCTRSLDTANYYNVNQAGTASLCRALAAARSSFKLIVLSSIAAGGPSRTDRPVREDDAPHPMSSYGRSKLLGEQEALKYRGEFPVIILRPSAVYGPGDRGFVDYFRFIKSLSSRSSGSKRKPACAMSRTWPRPWR